MDPESIARLIDAFVNSLDLSQHKIKECVKEGRPAYNLKVKWTIGGAEPDFRTLSDFRKDNIDSLKSIFREFNWKIFGAVEWGRVH